MAQRQSGVPHRPGGLCADASPDAPVRATTRDPILLCTATFGVFDSFPDGRGLYNNRITSLPSEVFRRLSWLTYLCAVFSLFSVPACCDFSDSRFVPSDSHDPRPLSLVPFVIAHWLLECSSPCSGLGGNPITALPELLFANLTRLTQLYVAATAPLSWHPCLTV